MKLATISIEDTIGAILIHNIADAQGHKALPKGHRLTADDVEKLRALGKQQVYVGLLEADDVRENDAVIRIARAVAGENVSITAPSGGRVNLLASTGGLVHVKSNALKQTNMFEGVTVATVPAHSVVESKKMIATIKTIGLALPESVLQQVELIARENGAVVSVRALSTARVAVILTGSREAQARVEKSFTPALQARVEELGSAISSREYVEEDSGAIAAALARAMENRADCVILAGETSIMDADDITPRGIKLAGGKIEVYGAPVEPGNLLLLAYCGDVPIIGAPGCVKSRETNVVDLILPRLLTGERVSRADVVALAEGGLLL